MFDGFKALYHTDKAAHTATLSCWEVLVNEQTGLRVNDNKTAEFRSLQLEYKPSSKGGYNFLIAGSLHKYHNEGKHNADQFTMANVLTAIGSMCDVLGIIANETDMHGLEIGVNIPLPFPVLRVLKNLVAFKGKSFTQIDKKNTRLGFVCVLNDYSVKLYDKTAQSGVDSGNVLRFEVRVHKMRILKNYSISTLADLTDATKAYTAKQLLIYVLDNIVWTDTAANQKLMSNRDQKQWLALANPKNWQGITKQHAYKQRKRLADLISHYKLFDTGTALNRLLLSTWERLFLDCLEAENGLPFHRLPFEMEAKKKVTISQLVYTGKKSPSNPINNGVHNTTFPIIKNNNIKYKNCAKNARTKSVHVCQSCGRDISNQRTGSSFCSEVLYGKAAKACRNKSSNHRRDLKRTLTKAVIKGVSVVVTYPGSVSHTEILQPSEIRHAARQWFDRVQSISIEKNNDTDLLIKYQTIIKK